MPLAKCVRCQKMFNKIASPVCVKCQPDEEADFDKVRDALQENPDLNAEELVEETDVSLSVVRRMLDQGTITITSTSENIKCGRCGAPAISATKRLCEKCLNEMNIEMAKAQANIKLEGKKEAQVGEFLNVRKTFEQKRK